MSDEAEALLTLSFAYAWEHADQDDDNLAAWLDRDCEKIRHRLIGEMDA